MVLPVSIQGEDDSRTSRVDVHTFKTAEGVHSGLVVVAQQFLGFDAEVHPFLNDEFGAAINQNGAFGGTPVNIADGGDTAGWTAVAVAGAWDFADPTNPFSGAACVSLTNGENNDTATFTSAVDLDFGNYTAISGQIRLEVYSSLNNSIILQFQNNNVDVGNSIDLNDYINTGALGEYQGFAVSKDDFGINGDVVDEVVMTVTRNGGTKPIFRFDVFQVEETGGAIVFEAGTPIGTKFHVNKVKYALADNIDSVVTVAGATENATMPGISYNTLLGVSSLTNGLVLRREAGGETKFSVNFRQLSDFLQSGTQLVDTISDGTNTFITMEVIFGEPIILDGNSGDNLSITVSDDLSGLLLFNAALHGSVEFDNRIKS